MIHSKFQSILPKNGQENGTETLILAKKCIMGKTHLKFWHHTKDAFSVYKLIHFGNMSYMYGKIDHLST